MLLRGVNVGKGNRLPMAEFRGLLEGLGYGDVRTLLNSGNAMFSSKGRSAARHCEAIATELQERTGICVPVIVLPAADLLDIIGGNPWVPAEAEHSRFLVVFSQTAIALEGLKAVAPLVKASDSTSASARPTCTAIRGCWRARRPQPC